MKSLENKEGDKVRPENSRQAQDRVPKMGVFHGVFEVVSTHFLAAHRSGLVSALGPGWIRHVSVCAAVLAVDDHELMPFWAHRLPRSYPATTAHLPWHSDWKK